MFLTAGWVLALTECRRAPPPFWGEKAEEERLGHVGLSQTPPAHPGCVLLENPLSLSES